MSNAIHDERLGYECIEMTPEATLFSVPGLSVVIANTPVEFPLGQHSHPEYEFMLPLNDDMPGLVEDFDIVMEKQKLTPINSWQPHGTRKLTRVERVTSILCERAFMERLAFQAFGQREVLFETESFEVGDKFSYLLGLLVDECIAGQRGHQVMQDNLASMLVLEIIRRSRNNISCQEVNSHERAGISRAVSFMRAQYQRNINVEDAAEVAGLSPSHFTRAFKLHTGKTPYAFLTDLRIEKAAEQLRNRSFTITEVALACGFPNPGHFSTVFRRNFGIAPSEYRRRLL